jgi:hypothetical protein
VTPGFPLYQYQIVSVDELWFVDVTDKFFYVLAGLPQQFFALFRSIVG